MGLRSKLIAVAFAAACAIGASSANAAGRPAAPNFAGINKWLNSQPLDLAALRGKVVLVNFWTYGCINCVRTLPHVTRMHATYKGKGLVVVGVHTPEFPWERPLGNVETAMKRHGIQYPVAQDNDHATWNAYRNQYWPAQYIIDKSGRVAFQHFGEGNHAAIEQTIRRLLESDG
jgi:thiol-disulfide isomerase/thioredoxin